MYIHGEEGSADEYSDWLAEYGAGFDEDDARVTSGAALSAGEGLGTTTIMKGAEYEIIAANALTAGTEAADFTGTAGTAGLTFTGLKSGEITAGLVKKSINQLRYTASEGMYTSDGGNGVAGNAQTNLLTTVVQNVQAKINTARVEAGSQYAALESAVNYTTDLTAQYELGYNTVNDVNFSMETAHLAKNQILQQAATAMLAQANQGQQGLLQLIS